MALRIQIDESRLRQLVADDLQNHKIADIFGCSESCIERRLKKLDIKKARTGPKSGDRHTGWKGGVSYAKGYKYIYSPDHPNCTKHKTVAEHRLVMEQKLERYLLPKDVVHHIDGNPLNNHPNNLEVFGSNAEHLNFELSGKVPNWTDDGKKRIQAGIVKALRQKGSSTQPKFDGVLDIQTTDHQT